ncbi:hypothetical protein D3C81_1724690 [compost metagenome]
MVCRSHGVNRRIYIYSCDRTCGRLRAGFVYFPCTAVLNDLKIDQAQIPAAVTGLYRWSTIDMTVNIVNFGNIIIIRSFSRRIFEGSIQRRI